MEDIFGNEGGETLEQVTQRKVPSLKTFKFRLDGALRA